MVSKAFFTRSERLIEDSDGRRDIVRYDGERFLASLSEVGRKIARAPFEAERAKADYLKVLVGLNRCYFETREYERAAADKYFKHDDRAERRFRTRTAERFSDLAEALRATFAVHRALAAAATDRIPAGDAAPSRSAVRATLLACTDRTVRDGWFPAVEATHYSLSPGELVAKDRERRHQRIEDTEASRGIRELLAKPQFERLAESDVRRVRELNRNSPGGGDRTWKRLRDDYAWYVAHDRDDSAGEDSAKREPQ